MPQFAVASILLVIGCIMTLSGEMYGLLVMTLGIDVAVIGLHRRNTISSEN